MMQFIEIFDFFLIFVRQQEASRIGRRRKAKNNERIAWNCFVIGDDPFDTEHMNIRHSYWVSPHNA